MKSKKLIAALSLFLFSLTYTNAKASTIINYSIANGDSLWSISQKYNTTISSITSLNNLSNANLIYPGEIIKIQDNRISNVETINYIVKIGDNLWTISQKYGTSMDTILKSNMLSSSVIMPGQILTIPVNSTKVVAPVGITMYKSRLNNNYGDIYTWENARRLFTVDSIATLKDLKTGITFNVKYYGGSNHSDVIPLTKSDTANIVKLFPTWSWNYKRPMILFFTQGGKNYQIAVSFTGMPHSTTNIYDNGVTGHFDLYFYNSTSHVDNTMSPEHQHNILIANGQ